MPNYCHMAVAGHLCRDPESRTTQAGKVWMTGTVAYNSRFERDGQKEEKAHFIPFKAFGYTAEDLASAKKGDPVFLHGRLEMEEWEKDGEKKSRLVFLVERGYALVRKPRQDPGEAKPNPKGQRRPQVSAGPEEIPF